MVTITDEEVFHLMNLLADEQEEFIKKPRTEHYAREQLLRMWLHLVIREGFATASPSAAILTATALDQRLPDLSGDAAMLAKKLAGHLRHIVAEREQEIRRAKLEAACADAKGRRKGRVYPH